MSIGFTEIFLIIMVVLLLFGSKRIPELARAVGRAKYEFEKARYSLKQEVDDLAENMETVAEKSRKNDE